MNLWLVHVVGAVFTFLLGSLLHFTYRMSGKKRAVAIFSAVNESTWEHLKLLFFPMLVFGLGEYIAYGAEMPNFLMAKSLAVLLGMAVIVCVFYLYVAIFGRNFLFADIANFALGVAAAHVYSANVLKSGKYLAQQSLGAVLFWVLLLGFLLFTHFPPHALLFKDPKTGRYGLAAAEGK